MGTRVKGGACLAAAALCVALGVGGTPLQEEHKLVSSDGGQSAEMGGAVAVDRGRIVAGARGADAFDGAAYVYEQQPDGTWIEAAKLGAGTPSAQFGNGAVAISGRQILVGALVDAPFGTSEGAAYVFERQGGDWVEVAQLVHPDGDLGDLFGTDVALDARRALVGAPGDDALGADSGAVFVYERQGGAWTNTAVLREPDGGANADFGEVVALSGRRAVVGLPFEGGEFQLQGAVHVFELGSGGVWRHRAKITASDAASSDWFGFAVAIDGTRLVISSPVANDQGVASGKVYVFERQADGSWDEVALLLASDGETNDNFGWSVDLDGDRIVVGAHDSDGPAGESTGTLYVFDRQPDGTWLEVATCTATDAAQGDQLGVAVAFSGDTVVGGAPKDDDGGVSSGAAYVFEVP